MRHRVKQLVLFWNATIGYKQLGQNLCLYKQQIFNAFFRDNVP